QIPAALDFLRSLPAFLSPYTIIPHFLSQYEKKGHQKVTFFDRLKRRRTALGCAAALYSSVFSRSFWRRRP
ncbi:MAG TPA: hypothetical protein H9883_01325, partial [Candidatus Ruthenibacterium merdigallinarum]|nr:hypothetical protein [Candidatus Ruthenibacterium merdigallinarum]